MTALRNVQNRQMYRDRKEKGGCIVLGGEWLKENED
jgi:hypothetical protein